MRLVPLAVLGAVFMVMLAGMALDSGDRWSFAGVGFGSLVLTGIFGSLRRRFTDQENIAGAPRVVTIIAVMVVFGLRMGGRADYS